MNNFTPTIWIEGDKMYATCQYLSNKTFVDTRMASRMTLENRLWRALRDDWGVLAETLKIKYQKGRVHILFDNDEEFIMAKLSHAG